jgi:hypothetical protein
MWILGSTWNNATLLTSAGLATAIFVILSKRHEPTGEVA